jgi:alpha-glucosidase
MKVLGPATVAAQTEQDAHSVHSVHSVNSVNSVQWDLSGGGHLQVQALGESLFRVRLRPAAGYKEPRTWAVAPLVGSGTADAPWAGRARDDLSGFSLPPVQITRSTTADGPVVSLATSALVVQVAADPLCLRWPNAGE